jgi:hypothetical protein
MSRFRPTPIAPIKLSLLHSSVQEAVLDLEVSAKLIEMLRCPVCLEPVKLTPDKQGLLCAHCHLVYPIRDGFPVMIKDEARAEPASEAPAGS